MEFNSLYHELVNSTEIIRALLGGITREEAQVKPNDESWSVLEVVCHLHDEEREDFREHLDFILNRQNEEWHVIDPQGWIKARKYNEKSFDEMMNNFFEERKKSLEWLKNLDNANWETIYVSQYGSMSAGEMFASWIAHDHLHIRQLVELRRTKIEAITHPYSIAYAGDW